MHVQQFAVGGDRNFAYIAADSETGAAMVVDPSYNPSMIVEYAKENDLRIHYVFNTHGHIDHSNGNEEIQALTGVTALQFGDQEPVTKRKVVHDARFPLGGLEIRVLHVPGHSPDSISLHVGNAVFTGDTLFVGKVGGTGYGEDARQEFESLHSVLLSLPDATLVFPGHDVGVSPTSTIGQEKNTNPFLLQKDFESFLSLKKNWLEYKKQHGIK